MSVEGIINVVEIGKIALDASKRALDIANKLKNVELDHYEKKTMN